MDRDTWSQYLDEIGRVPLLSHEQVVAAASTMEAGRSARRRLERGPADPELERDPAGAEALLRAVADGERARQLLVTSNLRLVVAVARRYRARSVSLPDLVQEGAFGLIRAVEKFDHRLGIAFSTYATWWIRQAMSRAVAEQARAMRLPKHVGDEVAGCVRVRDELGARLGREPSVRAVADASGVAVARVEVLLRSASPARSLQQLADEGSPVEPAGDAHAVEAEDVESRVLLAGLHEHLGAALDSLPCPHRELLCARVGWTDGQPRSLRTVAAAQGMSREVARRLEVEATDMLRRLPMLQGLERWLDA